MLFGKYVNKFYFKYILSFLIGVISLIVIDIAQLKIPEYMGLAMDNMKDGVPASTYLSDLIFKILLVAVIMWACRFIWRMTILTASIKIQRDLRSTIFNKITTLSRRHFYENRVGELMALSTYDVEAIGDVYGFGMIALVDCIFLGGLTLYKMFTLDWRLTLFALIPLVFIGSLSGVVQKGISKRYEDRQNSLDNLSNFTQENFSGIRVIKAFVQEKFERSAFFVLGLDCKRADVRLNKYSAFVDALISLSISTIMFVFIGVGGYLVYLSVTGQMETILSPGKIATFIGYFDTLVWPLIAIGNVIVMTSKGSASLKRVTKLLDIEDEILDGDESFDGEVKGKIEFKDLTFSYPDSEEICLKNISFVINPGEKIGIVGRVGSGKSTLSDILMRLFNVEKDKVFIDDKDIMNLKVKDVRSVIGYVPQDSFLFSDKVKNNISFANSEVSFEKIKEAAVFASVDDNIVDFDKGYDTITGERGVTLSGGQKQRISIARAYLKDAPIMILDDSVSAVDMKTEKTILSNINEYRKGKTTILIASRVSTVEHLDKILVINDGKVEGFASHKELIKISPLYKHMVQIQKFEERMEGDA